MCTAPFSSLPLLHNLLESLVGIVQVEKFGYNNHSAREEEEMEGVSIRAAAGNSPVIGIEVGSCAA